MPSETPAQAGQPSGPSHQHVAEPGAAADRAPTDDEVFAATVDRVADALNADAVAIVSPAGRRAASGFADGVAEQIAPLLTPGVAATVDVAGLGPSQVCAALLDSDSGETLVAARRGMVGFRADELEALAGLARGCAAATQRNGGGAVHRDRGGSEAAFRHLVERLPVIPYSAEPGENGRWLYVGPQIEEILGFTQEEWLADRGIWARQIHPDDFERTVKSEEEAVSGNRPPSPVDYRLLTRDGRPIWFLDEAVLEPNAQGDRVWHGVLYDITERKQAEEEANRRAAQQAAVAQLGESALKGSEPNALMDATVQLVTEIEGVDSSCIWELDAETGLLVMRAGTGVSSKEPLDTPASASPDSPAGEALRSGRPLVVEDWEAEDRFTKPASLTERGVRTSLFTMIEGHKRPFGVLEAHSTVPGRFARHDEHFVQAAANVLADAIERRDRDDAIRYRALHDPLTSLPNRQLFVEQVNHAFAVARRRGSKVAVLFLDLDHFKVINDSLGHHTGDELLRAVAPRLTDHLRPGDTVARFGGDEFAVLVEDIWSPEEAMVVAERVANALSRPFSLRGGEHFVTASVGVALAGSEHNDPEQLIRDADAAMYRAKEGGRSRCVLFDEAMRARAVQRLEVERELRQAIERDELVLHYQPVVALATGTIVGVEALVRWAHPRRGLVPPIEFIPVAEESGLVVELGRWVQEAACRQALEWQRMRPDDRPIDVAVNLSARQVTHPDLPGVVARSLESTGLDPAHLHLEITETVLIEDSGAAMDTLQALHELGAKLVLDDFGTGYSSLAYLHRFPLDALKIDRSFVERLGSDEEGGAIVQAIVGMARAMSLEQVAEGVETAEQLEALRELGCDYAQGFYFSKPLPAGEVTELLRRKDPQLAPS